MHKVLLLMGVGVVVFVGAATQPASLQSPAPASVSPASGAPAALVATVPTLTVANVPVPTLTSEEQQAIAALVTAVRRDPSAAGQSAQRAVRDAAEELFREPTSSEAAALAQVTADGSAIEVALPGGGATIDTTAAQMNHLVAQRDVDGRVAMTHDVKSTKGGLRDQ